MNALQTNLKKTFFDLIKIDEIYNQENEIIKYVLHFLSNLKISTKLDKFNNIIAYIEGNGDPILLNTHLDIPENNSNLKYNSNGNIISSDGNSILGADPKSGLAVLLELAKYLVKNKVKTQPIEFVFTRGEEAGLFGAKNLDYSLIKSKYGIVLDEDGECTNVIIQAPGYYRIDAEIIGKTVHTRDWKEGINAVSILGEIISKTKQGEIREGVTCNIGIVRGGTARNSVAGQAEFKIELRSFNNENLLKEANALEKLIKNIVTKYKGKVHIDSNLEFGSYKLNKENLLFKKLNSTYKKLHLKPNYYSTFGGSDANVLNNNDISTVCIGSAYYLAHQYSEYVKLDEMEKLFYFLFEFIK